MINPNYPADRLDETFAVLIPKAFVPANLHGLYDAYVEWTDKAEEAQFAASSSSALIDKAERQDVAEAEEAAVAGRPFPGTPNHDQAQRDARDTELRFRVAQNQQRKAARALLDGLRDHEAEITAAVKKRVAPMLKEYAKFLSDADKTARELSTNIDEAASAISFVEELRSGESKNLDIGWNFTSVPSFADAHEANSRLEEQLESLSRTAVSNYVHVVGGNGETNKMKNNASIKALISAGHIRRATPKEIAAFEG